MGAVTVRYRPLRIDEHHLSELGHRLRSVRWPSLPVRGPWEDGVDSGSVRDLTERWRRGFDWRAREAALNRFRHAWIDVDGLTVHTMIAAPAGEEKHLPVLALHGWPSTFETMTRLADTLSTVHATAVIAPSLPGFGFSDAPTEPGWGPERIARTLHTMMTEHFGYRRYMVRGTDFGLLIALHLGALYPDQVAGVHIGGIHLTAPDDADLPADTTDDETRFVDASRRWHRHEAGYTEIQSTKPDTLAYALTDSPVGLLAWITEKHRTWCATPDDLHRSFSADDLLSTATIYWATTTAASAIRLYREDRLAGPPPRSHAPVAINQPAAEEYTVPESWWARTQPVVRYTMLPDAGHFPDWENPTHLADDIAAFSRQVARA